MLLESIQYRANIVRAKHRGYFARFSWPRLCQLLLQSSGRWPAEALAVELARDAGIVQYATPVGNLWATESDRRWVGSTAVEILMGVYEHAEARLCPGAVVIDLGANLGTFTQLALDRGAAHVVAVEALPEHQECLRRSFAAEIGSGRVSLVPSPVWSEKTKVRFAGRSLCGKVGEDGVEMETVTIDEITRHLPRVDYIKADIEGAERHAVAGAMETLRKWRPKVALCTYHYPDDPVVIPALIHKGRPDYKVTFDRSRHHVYAW
jgi:FkbM family methyltransferase